MPDNINAKKFLFVFCTEIVEEYNIKRTYVESPLRYFDFVALPLLSVSNWK